MQNIILLKKIKFFYALLVGKMKHNFDAEVEAVSEAVHALFAQKLAKKSDRLIGLNCCIASRQSHHHHCNCQELMLGTYPEAIT